MIKSSGENCINQDPHVMEVAHSLVNDVIEKAREEVMKRKSVSQPIDPETRNGLLRVRTVKGDDSKSVKVNPNSFSSPYIHEGDVIVRIEGVDASLFSEAEAVSFIKKPSKSLDLIICKPPVQRSFTSQRYERASSDNAIKKVASTTRQSYERCSSVPLKGILHTSLACSDTESQHNYRRSQSPVSVNNQNGSIQYANRFWHYREDQSSTASSDMECDREIARYCRSQKSVSFADEYPNRSALASSTCSPHSRSGRERKEKTYSYDQPLKKSSSSSSECNSERNEDYKKKAVVSFDFYQRKSSATGNEELRHSSRKEREENVFRMYVASAKSSREIIQNHSTERRHTSRRQPAQASEDDMNPCAEITVPSVNSTNMSFSTNVPPPPAPPPPSASPVSPAFAGPPASSTPPPAATASFVPPAPAPPPPPPPALNGMNIPSIRLKSEISDRLEPPSKLHSAMNKDKKPFTYAPGGMDFSEIKSPGLQRRLMKNAQEPEDIVLPPTVPAPVNTNSLPPAACVGMMPQIAIPVFPSNNPSLNKKNTIARPVSPSPNTTGRPVSPLPNTTFGRPASPMSVPSSGRPISPLPPTSNGRPVSPLPPFSNGRPFSPMGRPMSPAVLERPASPMGRPMSPVGRPFSPVVGRPVSPSPGHNYSSGRPISPAPSSAARPMSPALYQRPVSPVPPAPPQRTQQSHLPQHCSINQRTIPISTNSSSMPVNQNNQIGLQKMIIIPPPDNARSHTNTIYINNEPIKQQPASQTAFPTLREAPPPSWLMKHPNQPTQEHVTPCWAQRNNEQSVTTQSTRNERPTQMVYERKTTAPLQTVPYMNAPNTNTVGPHVIPIRIDGDLNQSKQQSYSQQQQPVVQRQANPQRWQNHYEDMPYISVRPQNKNAVPSHNNAIDRVLPNAVSQTIGENDSKPMQSRSFKVLQKITGSEDDSIDSGTNMMYHTEGVPLSQLRRLHLQDDDQAFMNRVKAQVDDDTFLHEETDPRYRGSAIPSKAFRILQNMTDAGQVGTNPNATTSNHNHSYHPVTINSREPHTNVVFTENRPTVVIQQNRDNETFTKAYIPPSERQAEQEFRKYMGSSIPSRSFKILQAMTATQDTAENTGDNSDRVNEATRSILFHPNPWSSPPRSPEDAFSLWQDYSHLHNFLMTYLSDTSLVPEILLSEKNSRPSSQTLFIRDDYSNTSNSLQNITTPHYDDANEKSNEKSFDKNYTDVSIIVTTPSERRKSTSKDYHDELTKPMPSCLEDDIQGDTHRCKSETTDDCSINSHHRTDSNGSVDFWKEIAEDEEDLYFRRSRSTNNRPGYDVSDTTDAHSIEKKINSRNNSSSGSSSSYNVYEFSTNVSTLKVCDSKSKNGAIINDISDADEDSGMNSDTGKYISETDAEIEEPKLKQKLEVSEFRKLSAYERVNTHSRLYKLLMKTADEVEEKDKCIEHDLEMEKGDGDSPPTKEYLTLPLRGSTSSSSGINSPISPVAKSAVNEKLVSELVQDLLEWKKELNLSKLSSERLREVAVRSLQPTCRSASPQLTQLDKKRGYLRRNSVESGSDISNSSLYYPGFDILPSRAFKNLQSGRVTPVNWPKCPLVSSQSVSSPINFPDKS